MYTRATILDCCREEAESPFLFALRVTVIEIHGSPQFYLESGKRIPWEDMQILVTESLEAENSMDMGGTLQVYIKVYLPQLDDSSEVLTLAVSEARLEKVHSWIRIGKEKHIAILCWCCL